MSMPAYRKNDEYAGMAVSAGRRAGRSSRRQGRKPSAAVDVFRTVLSCAGPIMLLCLPAFFYLYQNACIVSKDYQVQRMETRLEELSLERERLQLQLDELSSPERVERIAAERLNMVYPEKVEFITIAEPEGDATVTAAGYLRVVWSRMADSARRIAAAGARLSEAEADQF